MLLAERFYLREPRVSVVSRGRTSWLSIAEEPRRELGVYDDARVAEILPYLTVPVAGADLRARLARRPDLLALVPKLVHDGAVLEGTREALLDRCRLVAPPAPNRVKNMVLGITGGVYASLLLPFLYQVPQTLCERVDVILTDAAKRFVSPELFPHLGNRGIRMFEDQYDAKDGVFVPHIELAMGADLVVVFPATAHAIARIAGGHCSDLVSLVAITTRAPVVILPAMNQAMWMAPAVARNVALLREQGHYIVEPGLVAAVAGKDLQVMFGGPGVRWDRSDELISLLSTVLGIHRRGANG
jgi:phosphopantothenoylcysteine decarboxylase/phosphopantothenate--cysteine ligase